MRAATIRRWDGVHRWTSLACTLFLLILCVTGLPLIFSDEITAWNAPSRRETAHPTGAPVTIDRLIAREAGPGRVVQFVFWDDGDRAIVGLGVADRVGAPLEDVQRELFDLATGARVSEPAPDSPVMQFLLDLHSNLLAGVAGELILFLVALAFIASLVSGVVLYAPFLGNRSYGAIRKSASRPRWVDLHNLMGIATAMWLTIVGATGLMNALEAPLFAAWDGDTMPRLLAPYQGKPMPARLSSVDAAIATAKAAVPGSYPTSVGMPASLFGSPRHYLIWMKGGTHITSHFFTPVLVDAADGHLAAARPLPWYLRLLEISRPLHFGDYGGLPLKLLWALLDLVAIAILASGTYLWFARLRRLPAAPSENRSV